MKRSRTTEAAETPVEPKLPSSLIIKFTTHDGTISGSPVEIPIESTSAQLEMLLNSFLENEEKHPYAFYVNDSEVETTLFDLLSMEASTKQHNFEEVLSIVYEPLAMYRVRPVTRCVETMPGHTDAVLHVSYSPDGQRLASGGGDCMVRFWNVVTSMPSHISTGHKHHILCTGWSPNGQLFVSGDRSGEIRLWDPTTGLQRRKELKGHTKFITSLSFEPLHINPSCSRFASSSKDHSVRIWNARTGQTEFTLYGHSDSVECVRWGGAGLLYTCSRDRTIKVWGIETNSFKLVRTLTGHAHRINSLALNCDYALRTGSFQLGISSPAIPSSSSSGKQRKNKKNATDATAATEEVVPVEEEIQYATATEAQQQIALEKYNAVVSTGGETLVSCSDDFTLFMWKPQESKTPVTRMIGHQQAVNHIAFSPDGRFLASASFDKKIKLWCGRTGKFIATLNGHVGSVYQVSWSPDSNFLVSGSKDSTVKLWSIKNTKKAVSTLPGHEDEVYALDWSPAASSVASGSKDRMIKIWSH